MFTMLFTSIHRFFRKILILGFFLLSISPLLLFSYLGKNVRYFSDDFLTAYVVEKYGFWEAQTYWYLSWTGRYSFTFLTSLVEFIFGLKITSYLPFIGLALWYLSSFYLIYLIFNFNKIKANLFVIAAAVTFPITATIISLDNFEEFIFWQTGILTYEVSVILFIFFLCFLCIFIYNKSLQNNSFFLIFLSFHFFLMGGFSETWTFIQIILFFILLFFSSIDCRICSLRKNNDLRNIFSVGLLVSIISFTIILLAPGNRIRSPKGIQFTFEKFILAAEKTFIGVPKFLASWFTENTLLVTFLLIFFFSLGFFISSKNNRDFKISNGLILLFFSYICLMADFFPEFLVYGYRPRDRIIFLAFFLFISSFSIFWFILGSKAQFLFKNSMPTIINLVVMLIVALSTLAIPIRTTISAIKYIIPLHVFSQFWDSRDVYIRSEKLNGNKFVEVKSSRDIDELHELQNRFWIDYDLHESENYWINRAAAKYYGLDSIKTK